MTSIRTDLNALTKTGLLQAYVDLVSQPNRDDLVEGSVLELFDMMGGDEFYVAKVVSIDADRMLLDVNWDVQFVHEKPLWSFDAAHSNNRVSDNNMAEKKREGVILLGAAA
ncbi:hypothetical protein [uncultured Friedmanniella sp.]|uniref:hypothetical protein n=1 Tax=uncultured Friedmanniella sp. TaxID=335381 RepID=UPI0035CBB744